MTPTKQATGLGRGLGELFQRTAPAAGEADTGGAGAAGGEAAALPDRSYLVEVAVDAIKPNPDQPRTVFDPDQLAELAASIRAVGLLQPIVVRPLEAGRYELVMGERRWRAARQAGLSHLPAVVRPTEEQDRLRDALLENLHRVQLNPLEEAAAYQQLLTDFGITQEELAGRLQRSRPQIANTIRLLKLPAPVQRRVAAGVLSAGHARALLGLETGEQMERLAERIVAEGLSVRSTDVVVGLGLPDAPPPRAARGARAAHPRADRLARELSDHFDTRVRVEIGRNKGRIIIEFAGADDLDRVLRIVESGT
ncbi:MAG: ParB/RepB/Spo0J family partition protein [Propionibacteriaceae bacterium]|jgi:ParB family chromosome partitioning protein|nr:ParB/RepB/Spo0J family partition protein [Propionibacteriaceae bacterium]